MLVKVLHFIYILFMVMYTYIHVCVEREYYVKSMNTYHFRIFHYHGNHLNMQHVHNQLQRNRYYSNIYLQNSHHYHYKFFRNISFFLTWR